MDYSHENNCREGLSMWKAITAILVITAMLAGLYFLLEWLGPMLFWMGVSGGALG